MKYYSSVVIKDNHGRFLVLHHTKTVDGKLFKKAWRFPGGKLEGDEQPIIAAARELKEELGIIAHSLRLVAVPTNKHDDGVEYTGFYYLVDQIEGTPTIMEPTKHDEMRWLSVEEIREIASEATIDVATRIQQGA